jgi:hypothetical protein
MLAARYVVPVEIARGAPFQKPDFKAPALGHGFVFNEADRLGHGRL